MPSDPPAPLDAVVAGGGLSGLCLAARLAVGGWADRRVLVVDDGGATAARSWGFWAPASAAPDPAVARSFRRLRIHAAGRTRLLDLEPYRYQVVRRAHLHRVVSELISGCPGFTMATGRVGEIRDGGDEAVVDVGGQRIRSRWVFDSVTRPAESAPDAWLAFTGWQVRCDRPVFDPEVPVLFDFRTEQGDGSRFVYVLPDDPYRALVEVTAFVPRHAATPSPSERDVALATYLREVLAVDNYDVVRREAAVLALVTHPHRRAGRRVLRIGAAGGLIKASTGYAYTRIQRDSAAIVASLIGHGHPFAAPRQRRRHRLLDRVLLTVLDREPALLQDSFARLFDGAPAARVLRFLDEDTGVGEELRLISTLRAGPFGAAAWAALRAARRRRRSVAGGRDGAPGTSACPDRT
ncbi:MAG TPA: lycopene cyclase family protein [Actinoplanes sp.]|nr:lycopene cyclase family protein [Actinoplanes sp.]